MAIDHQKVGYVGAASQPSHSAPEPHQGILAEATKQIEDIIQSVLSIEDRLTSLASTVLGGIPQNHNDKASALCRDGSLGSMQDRLDALQAAVSQIAEPLARLEQLA